MQLKLFAFSLLCCHRCEFSSQWQLQVEQTPFSSETFPAPHSFIWRSLGALQLTLHNEQCGISSCLDSKRHGHRTWAECRGGWRDVLQGAQGWPGVQGMAASARSKGLHGNKGKFVTERVKSRPVACRPLCLKRSLPAPTNRSRWCIVLRAFPRQKNKIR